MNVRIVPPQPVKIFIKAKPGAKTAYMKKLSETNFEIAVKEPPVRSKANNAIISLLADYFNVSKSQIKIVSGWTSRQKVLEIS